MTAPSRAKRERIIEAVRQGLEGDAAIEFIQKCGFAMTSAGIARHLRKLGGRGHVRELIDAGRTNEQILEECEEATMESPREASGQQPELFEKQTCGAGGTSSPAELFPTKKMTIQMPSELYEAVRLAARAEKKSQNQLIVELLTSTLARMPKPIQEEFGEDSG